MDLEFESKQSPHTHTTHTHTHIGQPLSQLQTVIIQTSTLVSQMFGGIWQHLGGYLCYERLPIHLI